MPLLLESSTPVNEESDGIALCLHGDGHKLGGSDPQSHEDGGIYKLRDCGSAVL